MTAASSMPSCAKNDQIRSLISENISDDARVRIASILEDVSQLNDLERLLLYMQLPGGTSDLIKDTVSSKNSNSKSCSNSSPWTSGKKAEHEVSLTYSWIKSHLEKDSSFSLPKQEVYDHYKEFCQNSRIDSLCVADFGKAMKHIFPTVKARRLGQRGNSKYCYSGLKKKFAVHTPSLPKITCDISQQAQCGSNSGSGDGDGDSTCPSSDPFESFLASLSWNEVMTLIKENASSNTTSTSSATQHSSSERLVFSLFQIVTKWAELVSNRQFTSVKQCIEYILTTILTTNGLPSHLFDCIQKLASCGVIAQSINKPKGTSLNWHSTVTIDEKDTGCTSASKGSSFHNENLQETSGMLVSSTDEPSPSPRKAALPSLFANSPLTTGRQSSLGFSCSSTPGDLSQSHPDSDQSLTSASPFIHVLPPVSQLPPANLNAPSNGNTDSSSTTTQLLVDDCHDSIGNLMHHTQLNKQPSDALAMPIMKYKQIQPKPDGQSQMADLNDAKSHKVTTNRVSKRKQNAPFIESNNNHSSNNSNGNSNINNGKKRRGGGRQHQHQQQQHQQQHHQMNNPVNHIVKQEHSPPDSILSVGNLANSPDGFHSESTPDLNALFGDTNSLSASQFASGNSLDSSGLQIALYDSNCEQASDSSIQAALAPYAGELETASTTDHNSPDQISQLRKLLEQNLPHKSPHKELLNSLGDVLNNGSCPGQQEVLDDGCNAYVYDAHNSQVIDSSVGNLLATSEELQNSAVASEMSSAQMSLAQSPLVPPQDSPLNQRYFQPISHQPYCESNCDNSPPFDSVTVASVGLSLTPSNSGSPFLSPRSTPVHQSSTRSRNDSGQSTAGTFFTNPSPHHQPHQGQTLQQQATSQSPFDSPSPFVPTYILGTTYNNNQLY